SVMSRRSRDKLLRSPSERNKGAKNRSENKTKSRRPSAGICRSVTSLHNCGSRVGMAGQQPHQESQETELASAKSPLSERRRTHKAPCCVSSQPLEPVVSCRDRRPFDGRPIQRGDAPEVGSSRSQAWRRAIGENQKQGTSDAPPSSPRACCDD